MKGKTTISIAHRIDTIKNSEMIYVFEKGKIVEQGNYSSLVQLRGYFYNLERGTEFVWSIIKSIIKLEYMLIEMGMSFIDFNFPNLN